MNEVAADELGLLLKGHKIHGHNRNKVPNRSGSAPPSMEGSFSAFGNLVYDQSSGRKLSLASLEHCMQQNWQSEERSVISIYSYNSNVNLNPRLPPPIIIQGGAGTWHTILQIWVIAASANSSKNSGDGSLHFGRPNPGGLPSHSVTSLQSVSGLWSCCYGETTDSDVQSLSLDGLSLDISNKQGADACADVSGDHDIAASDQPLAVTLEKESCVDSLGRSHSPQKGEIPGNDAHLMLQQGIYGHSWFSSVEVQAAPQCSGLTPPLYATAAAYMASGNPYYSNLSPSGGYAPQYNIGGYALGSPSLSPFLSGYPSMHINAGSGRSISGQSVAPRENIPQVGDLHHLTKFYGHHGLMVQPSFPDPFHMQYFHHPVDDSNTSPGQYMRFPSPSLFGLEVDAYASQKEPNLPSYIAEQVFFVHQLEV
ncbi:hypothetical protein HAX54_004043 [Datura stramonium]|uniref:Uncharacterized protein n=1 Tax=Datura stramonium TaxID=4076 RepID=A0ABS8T7K3_DATST|nr:hypothetical protein [Datura stramonium]